MLKAAPKATGGDRAGRKSKLGGTRTELPNLPATITDLGLDKKTSQLAQQVASLKKEEKEKIISGAAKLTEALEVFKDQKKDQRKHKDKNPAPIPEGVFNIIYCDPP